MLAKEVKRGELIRKVFDLSEVKDFSEGDEQRLKFIITSNRRDRDRDIVDPAGAMTDDYANNPVMLWAHQYDQLPIARAVEMERFKEATKNKDGSDRIAHKISALVTFQPDSNYHDSYTGIRGSMVYKMYKSGFLNAVSIGFDPHEWEAIEEKVSEEAKSNPELVDLFDEMAGGGTLFSKWDMLEFSAVPVPSNPEALVDRKMRKMFMKTLKSWAQDTMANCETCLSESIDDGLVTKPYENEHACRLRNPADFQSNSFRRIKRNHEGKEYAIIVGRLTGETTMTEQAYRYDKTVWSAEAAKAHCDSHDGSEFAAAKEETDVMNKDVMKELDESVLKEEQKAGRVLSSANETDLKKAAQMLESAGKLIEGVVSQVTGTPYEAPEEESLENTITVSYPLGQNIKMVEAESTVNLEPNEETKTEPSEPNEETETYLIDDDDLNAALEHFGLEAQGDEGEKQTEE